MIYLIRHGQTDWNLFKRFNGITETYLNQTGIEQAKLQAKNLKKFKFDVCYCSPQKRAVQYCEIIYKGKIIFDDRLTEINCGQFEGTEETEQSMKLFWKAIQNGDMGTENLDNFIKRNCDFCDMIMHNHTNKNILIVTHAANTRVINYYFNGKPNEYDFSKTVIEKGDLLMLDNLR